MILNVLRSGQLTKEALMIMLLSIPVVLLSLSFHEMAHGWAARKMGDPTAHYLGRITLNPMKHLDPFGTLAMLLVGIGWAKPVPINPRNFRNPRKGMALTGLAGPLSNLLLSFFGLLSWRICVAIFGALPLSMINERTVWLFQILTTLFSLFATMNCYLAVFNLIPVPPFDGSRIFYFLLPDKYYFGVMRYERAIMVVTLLLLFTGYLDPILSLISGNILQLFNTIIGLVPFL